MNAAVCLLELEPYTVDLLERLGGDVTEPSGLDANTDLGSSPPSCRDIGLCPCPRRPVGSRFLYERRHSTTFYHFGPGSVHVDPETVRNTWKNRAGEYSPTYYAYFGPNETSAIIRDILGEYLSRDAAVLELGCGSGRHLAHLADNGFENLFGVDINAEAFDTMRETYPTLTADGTFHCGPIEEVIEDFADGQFDAVYSVETLQHLHPDVEWIFEEVARVTDDLLVTAEIEEPIRGSSSEKDVNYIDDETPLYYRDWSHIFTSVGLTEIDVIRGDRDIIRTFRVPDDCGGVQYASESQDERVIVDSE